MKISKQEEDTTSARNDKFYTENTINTPLILKYTGGSLPYYNVNKAGDQSGEYVSKTIGISLLKALKVVTREYEYALKIIAEAGCFQFSENNLLISSKETIKKAEL